jgi:hypothetical protein
VRSDLSSKAGSKSIKFPQSTITNSPLLESLIELYRTNGFENFFFIISSGRLPHKKWATPAGNGAVRDEETSQSRAHSA